MPNPLLKIFAKQSEKASEDAERETDGSGEALSPSVDERRMAEWNGILRTYKNARSGIEQKIKNNERFWRMRQWKEGSRKKGEQPIPSTAWLFTCIQSKLADVMESYPTANFRPRQKDDIEEAKKLSSVVPVIIAQNDFEETYRKVSEYTLKNGVGVYHVYWDGNLHGGLGDIAIREVNVLNIFWEPGITDLQRSAYVFTVELVEKDLLLQKYPDKALGIKGKAIRPEEFVTDERADTHNKIAVVDVYYRKNGILHYCKYADTTCLESTENSPELYPNGLYDHGRYPFEVQSLYHIEQSLYGTGMVDIGADAQLQIDLINEAVVENTLMGAKPRFLTTADNALAEEELADWRKTFVKVSSLSETSTKQIDSKALQGNYLEFLNMKIDELKYVTSNLDVNNGAAPSGVTAASAIAALQESSGKNSRFINKTFYNTFSHVMELVVELIRQFYDTRRWFRVSPDAAIGAEQFMEYDNSHLRGVPQPAVNGMDMGLRIPEFDIEITAEKANPYKKMEINELSLSFYKMGFFNPQMADQAIACLDMMDFDSKDKLIERLRQNGTLLDALMQYQRLCMALAQKYGDAEAIAMIGQNMAQGGIPMPGGSVDPREAADPEKKIGENKQVEKARSRARNSTEVS